MPRSSERTQPCSCKVCAAGWRRCMNGLRAIGSREHPRGVASTVVSEGMRGRSTESSPAEYNRPGIRSPSPHRRSSPLSLALSHLTRTPFRQIMRRIERAARCSTRSMIITGDVSAMRAASGEQQD